MSAKHTPGPLTLQDPALFPRGGNFALLAPEKDNGWCSVVAIVAPREDLPAKANAERLRDCWNACEGIEDPSALRAQRDELLAVLKDQTPFGMPPADASCHYGICDQSECGNCSRIKRALAAIARAEGCAQPIDDKIARAEEIRKATGCSTVRSLQIVEEEERRGRQYNWASSGPGGCDSHCIESPCGKCAEEAKLIMSGKNPYKAATE